MVDELIESSAGPTPLEELLSPPQAARNSKLEIAAVAKHPRNDSFRFIFVDKAIKPPSAKDLFFYLYFFARDSLKYYAKAIPTWNNTAT
jgi:hypothetical protein